MGRRKKVKITWLTWAAVLVVALVLLCVAIPNDEELSVRFGLAYYVETSDADVSESAAGANTRLKVHSLDVGQGDCTIIELPDGKTMIIDGADTRNANKNAILNYIDTNLPQDFKYFDYAILTHSDSDHCGSLDDTLNAYPARVFYRPNVAATRDGYVDPGLESLTEDHTEKDTAAYKNCIVAGYKANADFTPEGRVTNPFNLEYDIKGGEGAAAYTFTFYSPLQTSYSDWNNYSPIMVLNYASFNFVFTGDAEKENEAEFVAKINAAKTDGVTDKFDDFADGFCADVIKAGHHGSRTSSSDDYLNIMLQGDRKDDAFVIVSCGEGNDYGHPHAEALERYAKLGIPDSHILRTDKSGDLEFYVNIEGETSYLYYAETLINSGTVQTGGEPVNPGPGTDPPDPGPGTDTPNPPYHGETQKTIVYKLKLGSINVSFVVVGFSVYIVVVVISAVAFILTRKRN